MISTEKSGVWILSDAYHKDNAGYWDYKSTPSYELYAWASNMYAGTLSQGNQNPASSPVQIPGTNWSGEASSNRTTLAMKNDGSLWIWGANLYGSLGISHGFVTGYESRSSPVQLPGTQWNKIAENGAGYSDGPIVVTKTDGTLWAWGNNTTSNGGALGQGDTLPRSSPTQIPGNQWGVPNVGGYFVQSLKTDGTLWSWGNNQSGQCGYGDKIPRSSPHQLPGTWSKTSSTYYNSFGIKEDGTLWSWGSNSNGELGHNDVIYRSSPVQIGSDTTWSEIASGSYYNAMATKTDGSLWVWGYPNHGTLGNNNQTTMYSSPIQLPGTDWSNPTFFGGYTASCKKSDGSLWVWGYNGAGEFGLNYTTPISRSSPVQIPGTDKWTFKSSMATSNTVVGIKEILS